MSDNIPIEVQTEILKRVPVKSLFQFRSVSKSWKSLIDSSQFIADYNDSRPQRLLIGYEDHIYRYHTDPKYVIIVDDDNLPQNKFPTTFPMLNSFKEDIDIRRPVGSSQGLLCFFGEYGYDGLRWNIALIWNPAINKSIAIQLPVFHEKHFTALGFGVCPKTNEPTLVVIDGCDGDEIYIFRLSSRVWRRLDGNLPDKYIRFEKELESAIDGFIYWEVCDRLILSFDMKNEKFTKINLPKSFESATNWSISKLRESLAVLASYGDENRVCDVWMMEHGVPKMFTKLFTITTTNAWFVLGFRRNGEPILEVNKTDDYGEPSVLEVYEPHTGHIKDLGIYAKRNSFLVMPYMETLLLFDQVDGQHIELKNIY